MTRQRALWGELAVVTLPVKLGPCKYTKTLCKDTKGLSWHGDERWVKNALCSKSRHLKDIYELMPYAMSPLKPHGDEMVEAEYFWLCKIDK